MNHQFKRAFVIVLDSLGIGNAKDAADYNDFNSNTLKHIDDTIPLKIPNLRSLGIDRICPISKIDTPLDHAYALAMNEASLGKDTLTGHYEIMGLLVTKPFKTFTETGFPKELIDLLEKKWNRKIIGNCAASGTKIIQELGEEQMKTKAAIVYTSSDSVLQIAAHEDVIPLKELYHMCEIAREITKDEKYKIGRIIARPFVGTNASNFKRTSNRHDYALKPFAPTMLNHLKDAHYDVIGIGKIADIFDNEGITKSTRIKNNQDGCLKTLEVMKEDFNGLCFVNLVDFDMEYGHRRDPIGYGKAIEDFDVYLGQMKELLTERDILMICADHGNDPTYRGTDHTREKVPLLIYSKAFKETGILPDVFSFATVSSTLADIFSVQKTDLGESIIDQLK
jgi:phosphopentomutase